MLKPRTHFEQVPVAVAKKILADEIQRRLAAEQARGINNKKSEEVSQENTPDD